MIVADTRLVAALFIGGCAAPRAEAVLRADGEWHAPLVWRSGFRNLASLLISRGVLHRPRAVMIVAEAERFLARREHAVAIDDVLRLAELSALPVYDCEFVALAEQLEIPLVTDDPRLLGAFPRLTRPAGGYLEEPEEEPPAPEPELPFDREPLPAFLGPGRGLPWSRGEEPG